MKSIKLKLIISNVLLGVLMLLLVGVTIAYFTDTKQISNTLTSGSVRIQLSEAAVKNDGQGNLVEDTEKTRIFGLADTKVHNYGTIYPGQRIYKDPTIVNTGTNDAWIAAKVTITDGEGELHRVMGYQGYDEIDIEVLLSGGLLAEDVHVGTWNGIPDVCYNDRYTMVQVADAAEGKFEFYFFFLSKFKQKDEVVLFDTLSFPGQWNNREMQEFTDFNIKVQAYASQTQGMETCFDAMKTAFPEHFKF